jgi:DNA mismatch endonuclease, patch repair protein
MKGNRRTNTEPEVALRRALHVAGHRFRKDFRVTGRDGVGARADIVFPRRKVVVFVDGCFWHGCTDHCRLPRRNRAYWIAKIERNKARDARVTRSLREGGWEIVRVWEHDSIEAAVARVEAALSGGVRTFEA